MLIRLLYFYPRSWNTFSNQLMTALEVGSKNYIHKAIDGKLAGKWLVSVSLTVQLQIQDSDVKS